MSLWQLFIFCDRLLEFIDRVLECLPFSIAVSTAKAHVNLRAVAQPGNHLLE